MVLMRHHFLAPHKFQSSHWHHVASLGNKEHGNTVQDSGPLLGTKTCSKIVLACPKMFRMAGMENILSSQNTTIATQ